MTLRTRSYFICRVEGVFDISLQLFRSCNLKTRRRRSQLFFIHLRKINNETKADSNTLNDTDRNPTQSQKIYRSLKNFIQRLFNRILFAFTYPTFSHSRVILSNRSRHPCLNILNPGSPWY